MDGDSGLYRKGNVAGNYNTVASTAIGFGKGIAATTVGAILSVVGMTVSNAQTVRGETFVSYRYKYRDGKGRWSSDPNKEAYWHLGYRTGQMETYKHVWGSKQHPTTKLWSTYTRDYTSTPAKIDTSLNYKKSNSWLINKAVANVTAGASYIETPW